MDPVLRFGRKKIGGLKGRYNAWREKHFDRRFGISTFGIEYDLVALGATGPHVAHAEAYEPIQIPVFKAIISAARIDPRHYSSSISAVAKAGPSSSRQSLVSNA